MLLFGGVVDFVQSRAYDITCLPGNPSPFSELFVVLFFWGLHYGLSLPLDDNSAGAAAAKSNRERHTFFFRMRSFIRSTSTNPYAAATLSLRRQRLHPPVLPFLAPAAYIDAAARVVVRAFSDKPPVAAAAVAVTAGKDRQGRLRMASRLERRAENCADIRSLQLRDRGGINKSSTGVV